MSEFEQKNVLTGILRVVGFLGAFVLFIIGFATFFAVRIIGNIVMGLSVIIIGYSIYLSYTDKSKLKYLNMAAKGFIVLLLLIMMYALNSN